MPRFRRFLAKAFIVNYDSASSSKGSQNHATQYTDEIGGDEYNKLSKGEPPETGTYPLHGNGKSQADIFETSSRPPRPPRPMSRMSTASSRFGGQSDRLSQRDSSSGASRPTSMQYDKSTSLTGSQASASAQRPYTSPAMDTTVYSNLNRPATGYSDVTSINSIQHSNAGDFRATRLPANGSRLQRSGSFSSGYSDVVERVAPVVGTYPLHGNSKEPFPVTPKAPKSTAYDSLREGDAPTVGTLPLHGNPAPDIQRARSKAARDREERGRADSRSISEYSQFSQSAISRSRSGARIPRRSHSGARYAAGEPISRRPSSVSSAGRAGVAGGTKVINDSNTYTDLSEPKISTLEDPSERTAGPVLDTTLQNTGDRNAKTPIANEFSYKTWYSRPNGSNEGGSDKQNTAGVADTEPASPVKTQGLTPAERMASEKVKAKEPKAVERSNATEQSHTPGQARHDSVLAATTNVGDIKLQQTNISAEDSNDLELVNTTATRDFVYVTSSPGIEAADDTIIEVRNKRGSIRYSLGKTFIPGYEERKFRATKDDPETAEKRRSTHTSLSNPRASSVKADSTNDDRVSQIVPMTPTNTRIEQGELSMADTDTQGKRSRSRNASTTSSSSTPSRRRSLRIGLEKLFMPHLHNDDVPPLPTSPKTAPNGTAPTDGKVMPTAPASDLAQSSPSSSSSSFSSSQIQNNQKVDVRASNIYSNYAALPQVDESVMRRHNDRQNRISSGESSASPIGSRNSVTGQLPEIRKGRQNVYTQPLVVRDASGPPSLKGIVNLNNTVETHHDTKIAKAVIHETIRPVVHHVSEERVTREIHDHDIHHRIQPIIDVQVLPTKHYVVDGTGSYKEVSADQLPARAYDARNNRNWVLAETVSRDNYDSDATDEDVKGSGQRDHAPGTRAIGKGPLKRFTAREFEGKDGDYKEWTGEDGVHRSETTWVHPPTLATGGRDAGQTEPIYFGKPSPKKPEGKQFDEDGLLMDMESKLSLKQ